MGVVVKNTSVVVRPSLLVGPTTPKTMRVLVDQHPRNTGVTMPRFQVGAATSSILVFERTGPLGLGRNVARWTGLDGFARQNVA